MAIYNGKHCVFEMVGVDDDTIQWNPNSNTDNDEASNDWNISDMRTTHLPARLLLLSSALQENLTNTTIQTATNGINGTLVSTNDKLFLAAAKEMGNTNFARTEENNSLITWTYWTTHTTNADRVKQDSTNTGRSYWLRSPGSGSSNNAVFVNGPGNLSGRDANNSYRISLCYAF